MAIGHRTDSSGDVHTPGATVVTTKPAGTASDDVLVAVFGSGAAATVGSWTAPSGWTLAGQVHDVVGAQGHTSLDVYVALGNVASVTFTKSGSIDDLGWTMSAFTGVDNTTPIDATGTPNSNISAATLTTNAVTIVTDQAWHLIGFGDWLSGTFSASSFASFENAHTNESAGLLYNTTPKSTGSTGTVVVTDSAAATNQNLIGVPFALMPAGGGGGAAIDSTITRQVAQGWV